MAMRSVVSCISMARVMETNSKISSLSGLRRFSDQGKVFNEEERAKEAVYIKKMEKERLEKLKMKAEIDNADKSDKRGDGASNNR